MKLRLQMERRIKIYKTSDDGEILSNIQGTPSFSQMCNHVSRYQLTAGWSLDTKTHPYPWSLVLSFSMLGELDFSPRMPT